MATNPISGTGGSQAAPQRNQNLGELDMEDFLGLMISELQNQDPLDPMDNSQMLQQISQIREIGATSQLTETLASVLRGQNLTSASSLMDKDVKALTDDGRVVSGRVTRVSLDAENVRLHIGAESVALNNISEITGG
jgi:flagellar basal-body rod modification protein FlgD